MRWAEDRGHCAEIVKPLRLRVYDDQRLPDPVQCAGCLIATMNRADRNRSTVRYSDGSSWLVLRVDEGAQQPVQDITALVQMAVADAMRAARPMAMLPAVAPRAAVPDDTAKAMAEAVLTLSEHVTRLLNQCADLEARVEFVEKHALARAELKSA